MNLKERKQGCMGDGRAHSKERKGWHDIIIASKKKPIPYYYYVGNLLCIEQKSINKMI